MFTAITRICFKFAAMNCQHLQVRLSVVWNPLANLFQSWVSILKWILVACSSGRDQPCPYNTSAEYNELRPVQYCIDCSRCLTDKGYCWERLTSSAERRTPNDSNLYWLWLGSPPPPRGGWGGGVGELGGTLPPVISRGSSSPFPSVGNW